MENFRLDWTLSNDEQKIIVMKTGPGALPSLDFQIVLKEFKVYGETQDVPIPSFMESRKKV